MKLKTSNSDQPASFIARASFDYIRQLISIAPMFALFVGSRENLYLTISVVTSATTLSVSILLLGLNFLVIFKDRKIHIDAVLGYCLALTPMAGALALLIAATAHETGAISIWPLVLFTLGEVFYGLPQQMLSRFAMAEWRLKPLVLLNIASPALRAMTLALLMIQDFQLFTSTLHVLTQFLLTSLAVRWSGLSVDLRFYKNRAFLRSVRLGLPNWLSGLGITALDNLAILIVVFLMSPSLAAVFVLVLRVLSVATVPMHSVASAKFSVGLGNRSSEIRTVTLTAVGTWFLGLIAMCLVAFVFLNSDFSLILGIWPIIFFPFLRTFTTFAGNYFSLVQRAWVRVWSSLVGILVLVSSFVLLSNFKSVTPIDLSLCALPIIVSETLMALYLGVALSLDFRLPKNFYKSRPHPD